MKYLLDTDHISILQRRSGPEFAILSARISRESRADLGFSIVSFHEQVLGCHAYINRRGVLVTSYAAMTCLFVPCGSSRPHPCPRLGHHFSVGDKSSFSKRTYSMRLPCNSSKQPAACSDFSKSNRKFMVRSAFNRRPAAQIPPPPANQDGLA